MSAVWVTKVRAPHECVSFFLGNAGELEQGKKRSPRWCPEPMFLRSPPLTLRCLPNLKPALQSETPGQESDLHRKTGGGARCASVHCLHGARGVAVCLLKQKRRKHFQTHVMRPVLPDTKIRQGCHKKEKFIG